MQKRVTTPRSNKARKSQTDRNELVTKGFLRSELKSELKKERLLTQKAITASERRQDAKMDINMRLIQKSFQDIQDQIFGIHGWMRQISETLAKMQNTMEVFIGRTERVEQELDAHAKGEAAHGKVEERVSTLEQRVGVLEQAKA